MEACFWIKGKKKEGTLADAMAVEPVTPVGGEEIAATAT